MNDTVARAAPSSVRRLIVGGALACALLVALAGAWYVRRKTHFERLPAHPTPKAEVDALATGGWRLTPLKVEGAVLAGLVKPPRAQDAPWILFWGGNADEALKGNRRYLEQLVAGESADVGLATWSYRSFDTSTGQATVDTFEPDAIAALLHLERQHGVPPGRVHLVSFSAGTVPVVLLARHQAKLGKKVASTTLLSVGLAPPSVPWWGIPLMHGPLAIAEHLKQVPAPVLVVAGKQDRVFPPERHARPARESLGERLVQYLEVDGGHGAPLSNEAALAATRAHLGLTSLPTP